MSQMHEAEVKLIRQSNHPNLWILLPHLPEDLKQTTGVPIGFDDDQGGLRTQMLAATEIDVTNRLGESKGRVLQDALKPRTQQRVGKDQSRLDGRNVRIGMLV